MNVYLISSEINGKKLYKIGITRREISARIKEFKTGNASELILVDSFYSEWGTKIESVLHGLLKEKRVSGEWFDLDQRDLESFRGRCEAMHRNFEFLRQNNEYFKKIK